MTAMNCNGLKSCLLRSYVSCSCIDRLVAYNLAIYGHKGLTKMMGQNARSSCSFSPRMTTDLPTHWDTIIFAASILSQTKHIAAATANYYYTHAQHAVVFSR